jgi:hypothetical protein
MMKISRGHARHFQTWARPSRVGAVALLAGLICVLAPTATAAASTTALAGSHSRAQTIAPLWLADGKHRKHKPPGKAPTITAQPQDDYTAPGSYAHFAAGASGYPKPTAHWQISFDHGAVWRNIPGAHGTSFVFMALTGQEGDQFRAVFSNRHGSVATNAAVLAVVAGYAKPNVETQPQSTTAPAGAQVTLVAAASGDPVPAVQWQLSNNEGASWSDVPAGNAATLSFTASSILNGYEFRAIFTNVLGTAVTSAATLTVSGSTGSGPVITLEPQDADLADGETAVFTASAAGSPAPSVQWQVSANSGASWTAIPGATSTTYSFTASSSDNRNEYEAVFSNSQGSATTEPAILGVDYELTTNWAGYVATGGGPYTSVSGTWTVPSVSCPASTSDSYSSQWIGIDGAVSDTVEQTGTYADCGGPNATIPSYGAWYEMLGDEAVQGGAQVNLTPSVDYPVDAGDSITATVAYDGVSEWTLTINDTTRPWASPFTINISWSAPEDASAEWIAERPELCNNAGCSLATLADFGTTTFTNASAIANGSVGSIAALDAVPAEMVRSATDSTLLAEPSPLSSGDIFTVAWFAGS